MRTHSAWCTQRWRLSISALGSWGRANHRKCNILINFTHYKEREGSGGEGRWRGQAGNLCKMYANNLAKCRRAYFLYVFIFMGCTCESWVRGACQLLAAAHKLQFLLLSSACHTSLARFDFLWVVIFICHICMYHVPRSRARISFELTTRKGSGAG